MSGKKRAGNCEVMAVAVLLTALCGVAGVLAIGLAREIRAHVCGVRPGIVAARSQDYEDGVHDALNAVALVNLQMILHGTNRTAAEVNALAAEICLPCDGR